MRIGQGTTGPCTIIRVVCQGCLLSPMLFNIHAKAMMREAMKQVWEGVKVGGSLPRQYNLQMIKQWQSAQKQDLEHYEEPRLSCCRIQDEDNPQKVQVIKIGKRKRESINSFNNCSTSSSIPQVCSCKWKHEMSHREVTTKIVTDKNALKKHKILLTKAKQVWKSHWSKPRSGVFCFTWIWTWALREKKLQKCGYGGE